MKYIITVIPSGEKFVYNIEDKNELSDPAVKVRNSSLFFDSPKQAVEAAKKELIKCGAKEEDITVTIHEKLF